MELENGRRADFHLDVSVLNDCTFIMLHHQSMSGLDSAPCTKISLFFYIFPGRSNYKTAEKDRLVVFNKFLLFYFI
jgi:hypothetical protein